MFLYTNIEMISSMSSLAGMRKSPGVAPGVLPTYTQYDYTSFTASITGGNVTYTLGVYVLTFKNSGSMVFKTGYTLPTVVNYLLVGGGGTGGVGNSTGAGGGGGNVINFTDSIFGHSTLTQTMTFTVATAVSGPNTGTTNVLGFNGLSTSASIGSYTNTSTGGYGGFVNGGIQSGAGGYGGAGGAVGAGGSYNSGAGTAGTSVSIRGVSYYFGGGGSGGNGSITNPLGGLGGGGGAGSGSMGNNGINPYLGPNGISQAGGAAGYANSGGGGAGCNFNNTFSARAGGSGIVVVWFTYP